ncbi:uncharacterized protein GIQ15_02439 [Arthroderma uncinatum]|uniref:uncharacterized protein n=1 Tax=Arthroderma uncinatum TaxID=74035 RepID=UPI00144ABBF7|nr:uncharacterized protein GIQ15_02439 [Arthroderma uncinatum]KAF3483115.1 hypothetical protein GIQ15_02439 [Arthroderma uncinatum]
MMPRRTDIRYNWVDGAESLECYAPGGYHPVMIDDILHDRYRIVDKLGFGGYSTVWLAQDIRLGRYVAVKVGISSESKSLLHEIKSLRTLFTPLSSPTSKQQHPGCNSFPYILDEFEVHGPNGTHVCYTSTPARCNLREVSFNRMFPLEVARALSGGLAIALAYIHSQGYVHGGFDQLSIDQLREKYGKPEAITVSRRDGKPLPPNVPPKAVLPLYLGKRAEEFTLSDVRVLLSDFGETFAPASDVRRGKDCNTPLAFQAPEARFEPQTALSYPSDIWSLATAIWEIVGMKAIFSTDWVTEDEMVSQHIDELGPMPSSWWERWEERDQFFDKDGRPLEDRDVWPSIDQAFEDWVQKYRRKRNVGEFSKEEASAILDLMRRMLAFRPEERPTVEEILKSEWMVKWVLPGFDRSLISNEPL